MRYDQITRCWGGNNDLDRRGQLDVTHSVLPNHQIGNLVNASAPHGWVGFSRSGLPNKRVHTYGCDYSRYPGFQPPTKMCMMNRRCWMDDDGWNGYIQVLTICLRHDWFVHLFAPPLRLTLCCRFLNFCCHLADWISPRPTWKGRYDEKSTPSNHRRNSSTTLLKKEANQVQL